MSYISAQDTLCGVERWPASDAFGELVCPVIVLWKQPGQTTPNAAMVAGGLKHGEVVQVTQKRERAGRTWYYVESPATDERPAQAGWVTESFLERLGANQYKR